MTEKRFNRVGGYVYDGDKCISHFEDVAHRDDIVKLLNELHEENENLKDVNVQCCNDYSAMRRDVLRYKEENEQLKNMVRHNYVEHKRCVNNYVDKIKELEEENEQLKQQVNELSKENIHLDARVMDLQTRLMER